MSLTASSVIALLTDREVRLVSERQRIVETTRAELSRVDAQIAATRAVLSTLFDPARANTVEQLLVSLDLAGLRVKVGE